MYAYIPAHATSFLEVAKRAVACVEKGKTRPEAPKLDIRVTEVLDELSARRRTAKTFVVRLDIVSIDLINHYIIAQPTGSTGIVRIEPAEESIVLSSTNPLSD